MLMCLTNTYRSALNYHLLLVHRHSDSACHANEIETFSLLVRSYMNQILWYNLGVPREVKPAHLCSQATLILANNTTDIIVELILILRAHEHHTSVSYIGKLVILTQNSI